MIGRIFIVMCFINAFFSSSCAFVESAELNGIVFWKADSIPNLQLFENKSYEELSSKYEKSFIIPLEDIKYYYWDEQFFILKDEKVNQYVILAEENGGGKELSAFSLIIKDKIVMSGINRVILNGSSMLFEHDKLDCIYMSIITPNNKCRPKYFFRFSQGFLYTNNYSSIHEFEKTSEKLFNKELYDYLDKNKKIIKGYFDIFKLVKTGNFIHIKKHEKFVPGTIQWHGLPETP